MIRAEGLTKYYGSRCVISDVSFSIQDRETIGFLGLNGAGKTTALRMLAGLLQPTSGRLEIDGRDALEDPLALRWQIGFLPERPPLYEEMRVSDYLVFAAKLRGFPANKTESRVAEVMERTEITEYADEPILHLSHGFRQRVGIAQAVVHDPKLVILDEPINGLDPKQIVEMRGLIKSLGDDHTVLLSSHILHEISQTCDRLLVLNNGRLVAEGPESELRGKIGGGTRFIVELVGERERIETTLTGCDDVTKFEVQAADNGVVHVAVAMKDDKPEALAKALVEASVGLRGLERERGELESIFIQLTEGGA